MKAATMVSRYLVVVLALVSLFSIVSVSGEGPEKPKGAFVHVHKEFDVFEGVVGKDMVFEIEIHNMGSEPAFNVEFFDDSLESEDGKSIKVKEGGVKNRFDKIDAGDYVTFKQVIVPLVAGPVLIPSSVVTYSEDKQGGRKISVVGSADGFQVLTSAQAHVKEALKYGRIVSLGFCKTMDDWIRFAVVAAVVTALVGTHKTFSTVKKAKDTRKRTLARRALGVEDVMKES